MFDSSPLNRSSADGNSVRKWIGKQGCDPLIVFRSKNTTKLCYKSLIPWFFGLRKRYIHRDIYFKHIRYVVVMLGKPEYPEKPLEARERSNNKLNSYMASTPYHQIITTTNYPIEIMFSHSSTGFKWNIRVPIQSEHLRLSKQTNKQTVQHEPAVGALDMQSGGTGCKPLALI